MDGTPLNLTTVLVAALATVAVFFLLRRKYDSNLPLFFYFVALVFSNLTDRGINPYLMYVGLISALLLRFEFMNQGFARVVAFFTTGSLCMIIYIYLSEAFGDGSAPF
jgi:predicted permease